MSSVDQDAPFREISQDCSFFG